MKSDPRPLGAPIHLACQGLTIFDHPHTSLFTMRTVSEFFSALADETRLQVVWLLMNRRELCVCDIMAILDITQSKASRHLATLRHAGLVVDRRDGTWAHYSLNPAFGDVEQQLLRSLKKALGNSEKALQLVASLQRRLADKETRPSCNSVAATSARTSTRSSTRKAKP